MASNEQQRQALDEASLAALRTRLEEERARVRGTLHGLAAEEDANLPDTSPANEPEDFSEMARDITQENTDMALAANEERLLAQVERALQRLDEGTYGVSEVSGRPIPLERLEAMPWATTNVDDPVERST